MLKKLAVTAAFGAALVGAGGAALAVPGPSGAPSTAPSTTPANGAGGHAAAGQRRGVRLVGRLNRLAHATWVTRKGQTKEFVTHVAIHGDVVAVSASSISVKAADGTSQTYVVGAETKVRVRAPGAATGKNEGKNTGKSTGKNTGKNAGRSQATDATIAAVEKGAHVIVVGVGDGTPTANRIVTGLRR